MPFFLPAADPAALFAQNRFADAADAARKSGESQVLIRALLRLDRWDEALGEAEDAARTHPADADLLGLLALAQVRAGRPGDALKSARAARKLAPESYFALVSESMLLSQWLDNEKAALPLAQKATRLRPDRPEGWWTLLQALDGPKGAPPVIARLQALRPRGHPFEDFLSDLGTLHATMEALERNRKRLESENGTAFPDTVRLPITRELGMVFVETEVNGKKVKLLFDTGASNALVLDADVSRLVRPKFLSETIVRGVQGKAASRLLVAEKVSVGAVKLGRVPFREVADTPMCDGIFGGALLDRYAVTLDFGRGELLLRRVKNGKALGDLPPIREATGPVKSYAVPFRQFSGNLYVPLTLVAAQAAGPTFSLSSPLWAILDTGAQSGILSQRLAGALASGLPSEQVRTVSSEAPVGVGTTSAKMVMTMVPRPFFLTFEGGLTRPVPYGIGASPLDKVISPGTGFETGALLGMPFYAQYRRVTFDYPNKKLVLETDETEAALVPVASADPKRDPSKAPAEPAGDGKAWVFVTSAGSWVRMSADSLPKGASAAAPFALPPGYRALKLDKADWVLIPTK